MLDRLLPFQLEDVTRLQKAPSDLITWEMGTGKTYAAIALDYLRRQQAPVDEIQRTLVVAPQSTLEEVWAKHFWELTVLGVHKVDPKNRDKSWRDFLEYKGEVFLVHWEALRLMPQLRKMNWLHVIGDEAHKAKNRKAQQTKALKQIPTKYKTAMSGTPLINRPDEIWSILHWLYPNVFRSYWRFYNRYVDFEVTYPQGYHKIKGPKNVDELREMIHDFTARRLKKDVLPDLPDKYYTQLAVELSAQQRRIYNQMKKDMIAWVGKNEDQPLVAPVAISQLVRLQQIALATPNMNGAIELTEPSSKLDALMELLDSSTGQVVVFTQFAKMVELVTERLKKVGMDYVTYTGKVPQKARDQAIKWFQRGNARVFVGTIAAGGVGIDLQAASTVVFLDRAWSPALNQQAEDRLHRFGQKNAVQVIDIVARNTVDRGRHQKLELKASWIRKLLDG